MRHKRCTWIHDLCIHAVHCVVRFFASQLARARGVVALSPPACGWENFFFGIPKNAYVIYFKNRIVRYSQPVWFLQNAQFRLLALTYQSESTIWGLLGGLPRTDQSALVWSSSTGHVWSNCFLCVFCSLLILASHPVPKN